MVEKLTESPNSTQSCWVLIPAYNEAETVADVATRARRQCSNVIVIDDGSTDGTGEILAGLDVTVLRNEQNLGKAGSLRRGFDYALTHGAIAMITLDADGQHVPEEIPCIIRKSIHNPGALLIGARRRDQRRASFWRYLANSIADFWISWAAGQWIEDSQSGFRLYPARVLREIQLNCDKTRSFVFESEVLIEAVRKGFICLHVPVQVRARSGPRESHFRPASEIARITLMVAGKLLEKGMYPLGLYRAVRDRVALSVDTTSHVRQIG